MTRGKQLSKRARRRIEVRYGPDGPRFIGYSGNLSRSGLMLRTVRVFAPGTVLHLEMKLAGGVYRVRGEVKWAREGPVQWIHSGRVGMGISFVEPPEDFLRVVETMAPRSGPPPAAPPGDPPRSPSSA